MSEGECRGCGAVPGQEHHKACPNYKDESPFVKDPGKKSPWAKRLEEDQTLSEGDREALQRLDQISQKTKPCLEPTKWKDLSEKEQEQVHEIFCGIKHLFNIAGFSSALRCTVFSEMFGELIGKHAKSPDDATLTISLYSERMVQAAQEELRDRQMRELLSKALRTAAAPEGRPN